MLFYYIIIINRHLLIVTLDGSLTLSGSKDAAVYYPTTMDYTLRVHRS